MQNIEATGRDINHRLFALCIRAPAKNRSEGPSAAAISGAARSAALSLPRWRRPAFLSGPGLGCDMTDPIRGTV